jgi:hypothetical protein
MAFGIFGLRASDFKCAGCAPHTVPSGSSSPHEKRQDVAGRCAGPPCRSVPGIPGALRAVALLSRGRLRSRSRYDNLPCGRPLVATPRRTAVHGCGSTVGPNSTPGNACRIHLHHIRSATVGASVVSLDEQQFVLTPAHHLDMLRQDVAVRGHFVLIAWPRAGMFLPVFHD